MQFIGKCTVQIGTVTYVKLVEKAGANAAFHILVFGNRLWHK